MKLFFCFLLIFISNSEPITPVQLLKLQYEKQKQFKEVCSNFTFSDDKQWPKSETKTSEYAQRIFHFNQTDKNDIYQIIFHSKEIEPLYF